MQIKITMQQYWLLYNKYKKDRPKFFKNYNKITLIDTYRNMSKYSLFKNKDN